jgi:Sulfotransferase family
MLDHGLTFEEIIGHLDRKKQGDIASWLNWYSEVALRLATLYGKPYLPAFGDKSPDFFQIPELVEHLAATYQLIYTVRDPRAILGSIEVQNDSSQIDKAERWDTLVQNYVAWKPYVDQPNVLVVRYEDLLTDPKTTMEQVYSHLHLPYSPRFLEPFPRLFPRRFLWETTVELESGIKKDFDASRIASWKTILTDEQISLACSNAIVREFMERFSYER